MQNTCKCHQKGLPLRPKGAKCVRNKTKDDMAVLTKRFHRRSSSIFVQHSSQPLQSPAANCVYVKEGEVKWDIVTETLSIEEAKNLTLKMVDLEYALP